MSKKKVGIGLIGLGMVSGNHVNGYGSATDVASIEAVCDARKDLAEATAERLGVPKHYASVSEMLRDDDVEAVDIMVPHNFHADVAIRAAEAGKHILVEKPIARTVEEGEDIVRAATRHNVRLMVANNLLFHPAVKAAREVVEGGSLGRLSLARAWSLGWFLYNVGVSKYRRSVEETGGGCLIDTGTHFVYLLRSLVGEVAGVMSLQGSVLNDLHKTEDGIDFVPEGEDTALVALSFENSAVGELAVSYSSKLEGWRRFWPSGWDQRIELFGSEGAVFIDLPRNGLSFFSANGDRTGGLEGRLQMPVESDYSSSFDSEIRHFCESVRSGGDFVKGVRGRDALNDLRVIEAAYRSSTSRGFVAL
jgi:predicted dehydrogenase